MDPGSAAYVMVGVGLLAVLVGLWVRRLAKAHSISTYVELVSRAVARERALQQPGAPDPQEDVLPAILGAYFDAALVKLQGEETTFKELEEIGANLKTSRSGSMAALTPEVASRLGEVDAQFQAALERRIGPRPPQDASDQSVALVKTYLDAVHPFASDIDCQRWSPVRWVASAEQFYWAVDQWYTAPAEGGGRRDQQHLFLVQHGAIVDVLDGQTGAPSETTRLVNPAQRAERGWPVSDTAFWSRRASSSTASAPSTMRQERHRCSRRPLSSTPG